MGLVHVKMYRNRLWLVFVVATKLWSLWGQTCNWDPQTLATIQTPTYTQFNILHVIVKLSKENVNVSTNTLCSVWKSKQFQAFFYKGNFSSLVWLSAQNWSLKESKARNLAFCLPNKRLLFVVQQPKARSLILEDFISTTCSEYIQSPSIPLPLSLFQYLIFLISDIAQVSALFSHLPFTWSKTGHFLY